MAQQWRTFCEPWRVAVARCRCGIACIVPPKGWAPPFALEKGTNGQSAESFRFLIRKQLTSHLCMRRGNSDHARKAASRCACGPVSLTVSCLLRTCTGSCQWHVTLAIAS